MLDKGKQDAKKRAHIRLDALRKTISEQFSDRQVIGLVYVEEFNSILHNLKEAGGVDLAEFSVPDTYFRKAGDGEEPGIEPLLLLSKINAALAYVGTL